MDGILLKVQDLKKYFIFGQSFFSKRATILKAIDGVDLTVNKGETLGLVGESGCGKSTLGRLIIGLEKPTSGSILFEGKDTKKIGRKELSRSIQIVFQDPYSSLDPKRRVDFTVCEPLIVHGVMSRKERKERLLSLMEVVGLSREFIDRYPHEFSGGQRQRIGIARALALNPQMIICDEPVSALDVSIQGQIINLLKDLQEKFELAYLFISHDLGVIKYISDRVVVMYLGKIMEIAQKGILFKEPLHPYTKSLLAASPIPDPAKRGKRTLLEGDVPSGIDPPEGCPFHTRCKEIKGGCRKSEPPLREVGNNHWVRCVQI